MTVAIVNLTGGGFSGGYRKYLRRIVPLLVQDPRIRALDVYVPAQAAGAFPAIGAPLHGWSESDAAHGYANLRRRVASTRPDVVFIPTARYLPFGSIPVVTMVRNMEPLLVPFDGNPLSEGLKNLARAWTAKRASMRARRVVAVSQFVAGFLAERWRIDPQRIGVVPHGVDPTRSGAARSFGPEPFVFTAGSIRPARGLEDAIGALGALNAQRPVRLVVAGETDPKMERYQLGLRRLAVSAGVESHITWAGHLNEADMAAAMCQCAAFVMTSRAEACPNTVLEAMSAGCASVSVDHQPMPEFFADAALYYRAGQAAQLAEHLARLLDRGNPEANRLNLAARRRAAEFPWARTSDLTIAQLEQAIA